jgi:hypothetical protein
MIHRPVLAAAFYKEYVLEGTDPLRISFSKWVDRLSIPGLQIYNPRVVGTLDVITAIQLHHYLSNEKMRVGPSRLLPEEYH